MSVFPKKFDYIFESVYGEKYLCSLLLYLYHHFFPKHLVTLLIVAGFCPRVKTTGSSPQWNILENKLCSDEKILRFIRNGSWSVFGANWMFHNIGDHQTQERDLR